MANGGPSCRFTKDGDLVGVAAKLVDVRLNPLECLHHVKHAHVASCLIRVQACKSCTRSILFHVLISCQYDFFLPSNHTLKK